MVYNVQNHWVARFCPTFWKVHMFYTYCQLFDDQPPSRAVRSTAVPSSIGLCSAKQQHIKDRHSEPKSRD
jgi:hypothetical protein